MKNWINTQIEWVKSFFSEQKTFGEKVVLKGSSKRIAIYVLLYAFTINYAEIVKRTTGNEMPDIPPGWALFLGAIIGVNILELYVRGRLQKSVNEATKQPEAQNDNK